MAQPSVIYRPHEKRLLVLFQCSTCRLLITDEELGDKSCDHMSSHSGEDAILTHVFAANLN